MAASGYIGVSGYSGMPDGWQVRVRYAGRLYSFGVYRDPEYAAKIYDAVVLQLRGGANELNFGGEWPEGILKSQITKMLKDRGLS